MQRSLLRTWNLLGIVLKLGLALITWGQSFQVRYLPFGDDLLFPARRSDFYPYDQGVHDITSSLRRHESEIVSIIKRARTPWKFDENEVRLYVKSKGDER